MSGCGLGKPSSRPVLKSTEHLLTVEKIFELANKAHFLYLTRNSAERGQLLKSVLLNCTTDGVSLSPAYRKPFDLIFHRAKNEDWSGREDLNLRPPGPDQVLGAAVFAKQIEPRGKTNVPSE
jgi:hypothetical protein